MSAETEEAIWQAVARKRDDHDAMKARMREAMARAVEETRETKQDFRPAIKAALPSWLEAR